MPKPRFPKAMTEHVAREFAASQQYIAIAVYYDNETLPHLAAHFYRQAVEERNHAMMMVQYLLDAGPPRPIPAVEAPQTSFSDAVAPVTLALEQERTVTKQISRARGPRARRRATSSASTSSHWFLREQLEEESSMSDLHTIVERAAETNLLLAEQQLASMTDRRPGRRPGAPPAAGGAL